MLPARFRCRRVLLQLLDTEKMADDDDEGKDRLLKKLRDTMDTRDPVFSDYSHVANAASIAQLTFAVGLRAENPEELVAKMLPCSRFVPRELTVKTPKPKKVEEVKICMRPECVARRERLQQLNGENDELRTRLTATQAKLAASQNKIVLTEKAIGMGEDKIDSLRGQIEDTQNRIVTTEAEVDKIDSQNSSLRTVLADLQAEIERLKAATASTEKDTQAMLSGGGDRVVFASSATPSDAESARLIASLSLRKYASEQAADESDDD